ncbi:MAG TPA: PAS domain S-box protein [Balneolaceae bacterium]|nr:PAS domain S-box protein [Balneolaceae bacterium]
MENIEIPFSSNPIPIYIFDIETLNILEVNNAMLDLYGYTRDEMLSMTIKGLRENSEVSKLLQTLEEIKCTSLQVSKDLGTWKHIDKDGNTIYIRATFSSLAHHGKNSRAVFIQDVTKESELQEKLKTERDILNKILKKLPGAFYIVNKKGDILRWNKKMEAITGYEAKEISGLNIFDLSPNHEMHKIRKAFSQVFSKGFAEIESVTKTKSGGEIPFYFVASTINYQGQDCVIGISVDISETLKYKKQLEESIKEKETLLSEIHHRVKNNLAIISSLMELHLMENENDEVKRILRESQNRIKSIALTHEQLYNEQKFSEINYSENIRRLIQNIKDTFNTSVKFDLDLDNIDLNLNLALPASLLINEIVTNAIIHAFEDGQENTISVHLKKKDDHIHLRVKDNGKGMLENHEGKKSDTLGMQLINVLADQIDAEMNHYNDAGTVYEFQFQNNDTKGIGNRYLSK